MYRTNRDIFSNHYLDEHLRETEEWNECSDDELWAAYDDILDLYEREKNTAPKRNESQLEETFIRPVFRKLGIPFEVEESVDRTQRRPDYGFFESEDAARDAFERREQGDDFYRNAVAVADAKRWGRPLDTRGSGEHERDFENPSYQIHVYLQETPVRWAVLTDGQNWRLYYGPTSHRLDSYYEVDLPRVLERGDLEEFKYFYLFFRHEAFLEDASGDCFLDNVYEESNVFAQELGEDLQENIYEAIKVLSEGYLQYPENELDESDLGLIHDSSLIYLYRIIFVLYAEAEGRDLLNTDNEIYEESYSLNSLKQEIADELDSGTSKYRDWQNTLSTRLDELFMLIDQGSKSRGIPEDDLYIPAYNGGLFRTDPDEDDSPEAQFLATHDVGDASLATVIELLTRSENGNGGGKRFVDYSSLDVRHLGSIYEGLLEYQLHVADESLAVDNETYVPAEDGEDVVVEPGEVYLTTDSGERKATGSYYTPEYVVEYIVENTLEPLVEDIRMKLAGQSAYDEGGFAGEFTARIFELKILDPAMGSGHFLTSAVDYLAREIIDAQEKQAAQDGVETVDNERDINWARRQVAQRCIYGVDLNPLAVELSKVSLWLRTLAAEQPLAFLDHHLKTGNSLVGSDIETVLDNGDLENGPDEGQLTLQQSFDRTRQQALEHVTDQFEELLAIDNETLDDIKEMEAVYEDVREDPLYQHLIAMANVHTAEQFGLDIPTDAYERMAEALRDDSWAEIEEQDWYRSAQELAENQRFFHWELEFPIAFYEQDGERMDDGGFDAVIGNPPYFSISNYSDEMKQYVQNSHQDIYSGNSDILYYFIYRGIENTRSEGMFGMIVARYFAEAEYAERLRKYISEKTRIKTIVDFKNFQVFQQEADVLTYIVILEKNEIESAYNTNILRIKDEDATEDEVSTALMEDTDRQFLNFAISAGNLGEDAWNLTTRKTTKIKNKMDSKSQDLKSDFDVVKSMETGLNEAFVVSEETINRKNLEKELLRKLAKTKNVKRYHIKDTGKWIIWPEVAEIEHYPNIQKHLEKHRTDLEERYDIKARNADWWRISNPRNENLFDSNRPRILTPFMSTSNKFSLDTDNHFNDGGDIRGIFPKDQTNIDIRYVLCVLNSTACEYYHKNTAKLKRDNYYEYYSNSVGKIPIPTINFNSSGEERDEATSDLVETYESYLQGNGPMPIPDTKSLVHDFLAKLADRMSTFMHEHNALNLNLLDYLGVPSDELPNSIADETLEDLQMPVAGVSDTPLVETTEEYDGLRIEGVTFENEGDRVIMSVDVSYKPDEDDSRETDRWGRLTEEEFETYGAMAFVGLSDTEEMLLKNFVPVAVEKAEGFAGFRKNATKTNSPLDRLKGLTLPDIDEVRTGLEQYMEVSTRANELEEKIEKTDQLIDEIVYDLYGLTDEEIEIVEETVGE